MAARKKNGKSMLPAGYVPLRTRLDGFFALEPGNTAKGVLKGTFEVKDKFKPGGVKRVFRIQLTDGETNIGDGELVGPGAVIGIDEKGYTQALGDEEIGSNVCVVYAGLQDPEKDASRTNPHIFHVGRLEA